MGAGLGLAELPAVGLGDEGRGDDEGVLTLGLIGVLGGMGLSDEVGAGGHVAPLVAPAELDGDAEGLVEVEEVVGLEDHVTELGVTDALIAVVEAIADRVLLDHRVDGEVLADVTQGVEVGEFQEPVGVVDEDRGVLGRGREVDKALEDAL